MERDEFARNLAAGSYDLIVLDVLRDGPSYGYGIRKRIFDQSNHSINWRPDCRSSRLSGWNPWG